MSMRVGVHLDQRLPASPAEQACLAEQLGFHRVWFADAFWPPNGLDVTAIVGTALQATARISVGVNVFNTAIRRTQDIARFAASIEGLFPGRFILGLGAGRSRYGRAVASAWGYPLRTSGDQLAYLGDALAYLEEYFREPTVTFSGAFLTLEAAEGSPFLAGRQPPTLVAGHTDDVLRLVAAHADLWEGMAVWRIGARDEETHDEFFTRTHQTLCRLCHEVGRDPADITICQTLYIALAASQREAESIAAQHQSNITALSCVGTPIDLVARLRELDANGVDEVQLVPLDHSGRAAATDLSVLQLIGQEVLPAL